MDKTFKIVENDVSDGFHTFSELYDHRCLLFVSLCLSSPSFCAWRKDFEDGFFVLFMETRNGQISYHLADKYLPLVKDRIVNNPAYEWDGHTSKDVVDRLTTALMPHG